MFMGFIIHFYIIFGTNLLTQSPVPVPVFSLVSVFRRKGISNRVQTEWNLRESYFWKESNPRDLECTSGDQRGEHEEGGAPSTLMGPSLLHRPTSSSYIYWHTLKTSRSTTKPYFNRCNLLYQDIPSRGLFRSSTGGGIDPRGPLHQLHGPSDDVWVVYFQTFGSIVIS